MGEYIQQKGGIMNSNKGKMDNRKRGGTHASGISNTKRKRARNNHPRLDDTSARPAQIHHRIRIILLLAVPPVPSIDLHVRLLGRHAVHLLHVLLQRRAPAERLVRVGADVADEAAAAAAVRTRPALAPVPREGVLGAVRPAAAVEGGGGGRIRKACVARLLGRRVAGRGGRGGEADVVVHRRSGGGRLAVVVAGGSRDRKVGVVRRRDGVDGGGVGMVVVVLRVVRLGRAMVRSNTGTVRALVVDAVAVAWLLALLG